MRPRCCRLSANDGVPERGLADGGGDAFLSRSGRQEPQAGKLLRQSHPESSTERQKNRERLSLYFNHLNGKVVKVVNRLFEIFFHFKVGYNEL